MNYLLLVLLVTRTLQALPARCLLLPTSTECLRQSFKYSLKRQHLTDTSIECNDGSPAGYYIRRNENSDVWVIYLEGGWFCYDEESCLHRMNQSNQMYSMTSSKLWSEGRIGDGFLSSDQIKNPSFWNANHVYIPYCSSDFWVGNTKQQTKAGSTISFHGSKILKSVISTLLDNELKDSGSLVLAGSSAGGIGVLQNIDNISEIIAARKPKVKVHGIIDSAWFLDSGISSNCISVNAYDCHPQLLFKLAIKYWKAILHTPCYKDDQLNEQNCLYAPNMINTLKTPVFVFQWLYDSAQILADNKDLELHPERMNQQKYRDYVSQLGKRMKVSLRNIDPKHGVFSPACLSHSALTTTSMFDDIVLNDQSFNDALKCWLFKHKDKSADSCNYKLIDKCDSIKCHEACPVIHNPITGQRMFESIIPTADTSIPADLAKYDLELLAKILHDIRKG